MNTGIIYFTRSGVSKRVADKLGNKLESKVYEINDPTSYKGIFGYLRGGYYASRHHMVDITFDKSLLDHEKLIIVTPLWASTAAPGILTFLDDYYEKNITMVFTNDGSDVTKAYKKIQSYYPNITDFYGITKKHKNEESVIESIVKNMS